MNQYVTGAVIKELREEYHFTQAELAKKFNVSDKTISKRETAKGYPDISLLEQHYQRNPDGKLLKRITGSEKIDANRRNTIS